MIDRTTFERVKRNYRRCASWAVWADGGNKPKDNVSELGIFDIEDDDALLRQLNPHIVLVGLNVSGRIPRPLGNFHSRSPNAMDYKIRFALKGTELWGAYMTDIIKDFEQKASGKMMAHLRKRRDFERVNIELFKTELRDLGVEQPTLIAFGRDAFDILNRNLAGDYDIWKLPHYSNYSSKETYREEVAAVLRRKGVASNDHG
jgi:hypothetical protein